MFQARAGQDRPRSIGRLGIGGSSRPCNQPSQRASSSPWAYLMDMMRRASPRGVQTSMTPISSSEGFLEPGRPACQASAQSRAERKPAWIKRRAVVVPDAGGTVVGRSDRRWRAGTMTGTRRGSSRASAGPSLPATDGDRDAIAVGFPDVDLLHRQRVTLQQGARREDRLERVHRGGSHGGRGDGRATAMRALTRVSSVV